MGFYDNLFRGTHLDPHYYDEDCCGTCGSHLYAGGDNYTCQCRASPYYGEFTEYDDTCDEYHERGTRRDYTPYKDFSD